MGDEQEQKQINESKQFALGLLVGILMGAISLFIHIASEPVPEPCNEEALLKVIHEQELVIQKYTGYKNWFREVHGIDTSKMEQFKHK